MKRFGLIVAVMVAVLAAGSRAQAVDTYTIDGVHSSVTFKVLHLKISTVSGRFTQVSGTVLFDPKAVEKSSVVAVIKTVSINTDNEMRDKHLNSPEFFDTAKFPEIRFQSTSVRALGGDKYLAVGNLTIRDVTRQVEIPFTLAQGKGPKGEARLGVEAALSVDRFDYHVAYDPTGLGVGKVVQIELNVEAAQ